MSILFYIKSLCDSPVSVFTVPTYTDPCKQEKRNHMTSSPLRPPESPPPPPPPNTL